MAQYAKETSVSVANSQAEIERILMRYGAAGFMRGWDQQKAYLAFQFKGRQVKFVVPMPNHADFKYTETGRTRKSEASVTEAWEQGCRQRWRALKLVIQAKLEAVETGISTFEDEFMANILLPNGETVGDWAKPQIEHAYLTGEMPPLLPSGK